MGGKGITSTHGIRAGGMGAPVAGCLVRLTGGARGRTQRTGTWMEGETLIWKEVRKGLWVSFVSL